jgi:hypothetical protein
MTEQEWLKCKVAWKVWEAAKKRSSPRKFRLFLAACGREFWPLMTDYRCRSALETAERFADGLASDSELESARSSIRYRGLDSIAYLAFCVAEESPHFFTCEQAARIAERKGYRDFKGEAARAAAEAYQAQLTRDIFGNPFRPVTLDPRWLTASVLDLACAIYDGRAFERLPILADALMDAGCDSEEVLNHCRGAGPHVRGCWVVDLILGKK